MVDLLTPLKPNSKIFINTDVTTIFTSSPHSGLKFFMPALDDLTTFLDHALTANVYKDEQTGIYLPSGRNITRLGVALEPPADLQAWVKYECLDALFLHRPWRLEQNALPDNVGVLAYHLPFDDHLTLSFNPRLAAALGLKGLEVLGTKEARRIGMIGDVEAQSVGKVRKAVEEAFGGLERVHLGPLTEVTRVAVVGAMNPGLIHEAFERGAGVYITGQYRKSAQKAVLETGLSVLEVGHRRSELWGLRALAGMLRERWADLAVLLYEV